LFSEAEGDIEEEGKVLVIRRIHVTYHLKIAPEHRETAQRVHGVHSNACPLARTLRACVQITTSLEMEDA